MQKQAHGGELRQTGIPAVGPVPWGAHFCHFYETKEDLLEILLPYFKAGLDAGEFCLWVVSEPINEQEAKNALRRAVPDLDQRIAAGDIQIVPHRQWYCEGGKLDLQKAERGWEQKLSAALAKGYAGMRVNGNETWLGKEDWNDFLAYERRLNNLIAEQRMIILCTYPMSSQGAPQLFDVARSHEFVVAKRRGNFEILETPELQRNRAKEMEKNLRDSRERLRALSGRVEMLREEERIRISREIHDQLGQNLTALRMDLVAMERKLAELGQSPAINALVDRMVAATEVVDSTVAAIQEIAAELRPGVLDKLGLAAALQYEARRFQRRTGLVCDVTLPEPEPDVPDELSTALFRIFQESLTNVARHAGATKVRAELKLEEDNMTLRLQDDGKGISEDELRISPSLGVLGMKERAALFGGEVSLRRAPEAGTIVTVRIPRRGT